MSEAGRPGDSGQASNDNQTGFGVVDCAISGTENAGGPCATEGAAPTPVGFPGDRRVA